MNENTSPFALPRDVRSIDDCYFYHSMTLPGHGEVSGEWDLRGHEKEYLGNVELAGKNVLEIGTASGHLGFWMEKQGAKLVGYDLSDEQEWDIVPYHNYDYKDHIDMHKKHIKKLNNSWWFAHRCFNSKARVAYGSIYELSPKLGTFDVVTMGSILLHLRDPFLAMQRVSSLSRETLVVTDMLRLTEDQATATLLGQGRNLQFLPDAQALQPFESWWGLSPHFVAQVAMILGFNDVHLSLHRQRTKGKLEDLYTIVARRGGSGAARYNEDVYNRWVDENYGGYEHVLNRISTYRLARYLRSRLLKRVGLAR
jgi:2-polyprenyl-3-methyl-5-hydroxy-6-metoxy-1,4-benzoquinol methylase